MIHLQGGNQQTGPKFNESAFKSDACLMTLLSCLGRMECPR